MGSKVRRKMESGTKAVSQWIKEVQRWRARRRRRLGSGVQKDEREERGYEDHGGCASRGARAEIEDRVATARIREIAYRGGESHDRLGRLC